MIFSVIGYLDAELCVVLVDACDERAAVDGLVKYQGGSYHLIEAFRGRVKNSNTAPALVGEDYYGEP